MLTLPCPLAEIAPPATTLAAASSTWSTSCLSTLISPSSHGHGVRGRVSMGDAVKLPDTAYMVRVAVSGDHATDPRRPDQASHPHPGATMTMRAVVHTRFGPPEVLHLAEIPRPVPGPGDVLVRVHSTTVNRTDCGLRSATPWIARFFTGWLRPRHPVLGTEFAGVVEAVGADVTGFAPGDRVFGVNANDMGAHAEYLCLPEQAPIATMPDEPVLRRGGRRLRRHGPGADAPALGGGGTRQPDRRLRRLGLHRHGGGPAGEGPGRPRDGRGGHEARRAWRTTWAPTRSSTG